MSAGSRAGRLAQMAYPAKVVSLVVSDVPGDDPAQVASGPTVPDAVSADDVRAMIASRKIVLPDRIMDHINSDACHAPLPDDPVFSRNEVHVIASAGLSLEAAAAASEKAGIPAVILSDAIEGEAAVIGQMHAALACEVARKNRPFAAPVVILSGGETTVTLTGTPGRGGRNTAFLLGFAQAIDGATGIDALAADTDGIDGSEDNAGAFADGKTCFRLREKGLNAQIFQSAQDPYGAFDAIDDIYNTGPTGTNVNDFRAILITSDHLTD